LRGKELENRQGRSKEDNKKEREREVEKQSAEQI